MEDNGVREFAQNVRMVKAATKVQATAGLQYSANEVIKHAQANHQRGKGLPRSVVRAHPSDRFYSWSNVLINSMQPGNVVFGKDGPRIEVKAVAPYAGYVEAPQEINPASTKRAFPFMKPALNWFEKLFLPTMARFASRAIG